MIDFEKLAAIKAGMKANEVADPLAVLSERELRKLRGEIDRLLPVDGVRGLDLEDELVQQFHKTKELMDSTLSSDAPPNQMAQVCNSVVTILAQLVKLQEDLKTQAKLVRMEAVLIDVIKTLPEASKNEFFLEYERQAAKEGLL